MVLDCCRYSTSNIPHEQVGHVRWLQHVGVKNCRRSQTPGTKTFARSLSPYRTTKHPSHYLSVREMETKQVPKGSLALYVWSQTPSTHQKRAEQMLCFERRRAQHNRHGGSSPNATQHDNCQQYKTWGCHSGISIHI